MPRSSFAPYRSSALLVPSMRASPRELPCIRGSASTPWVPFRLSAVNSRHESDGASPPPSRSGVSLHLNRNVGGLLYGALIAASSMTVVSVHPPSGGFVGLAALVTLTI